MQIFDLYDMDKANLTELGLFDLVIIFTIKVIPFFVSYQVRNFIKKYFIIIGYLKV